MVESHVLSQVGITASWRRRYKAGKPSERLTSSAGRLLSTHHNRQPQAATATKKTSRRNLRAMQSRGCTYGARDAPIATHAYDNTHTQTPLTYTPTNLSHVHVHTHADQRVACGGHVLRLRSRSSFVCVGKCCWWHRNALANGIVVVIVAVAVVASLLLPLLLSA